MLIYKIERRMNTEHENYIIQSRHDSVVRFLDDKQPSVYNSPKIWNGVDWEPPRMWDEEVVKDCLSKDLKR